jgi:hypothetical protein
MMRLGGLFLGLLAAVSCAGGGAPQAYAGGERTPVVVELFSSEGCSSCPPADVVLAALAKSQPVAGAEVIALEMHVDYWNSLGWVDPFSSATYTARQRAYADAFGASGVYTPQMVIDGHAELVGSRGDAARTMIAEAVKTPKAKVDLVRHGDRVTVNVAGLAAADPADVLLAVTEDGLSTAVPRGENAGATLAHGPVVRELKSLGTTSGASFTADVEVPVAPAYKRENVRAVVVVQRKKGLSVLGAGAVSMR